MLRDELGKYFELKQESIGPPKIYLGGKACKVQLENGIWCWGYSSSQYVQTAIRNVETWLNKGNNKKVRGLLPNPSTPLPTSYWPELDVSQELEASESSYYASLIGVLRLIVELGRIDICLEVSMMSSHVALPCVGHLQNLLRIFGYLKKHHNAELVYDPSQPSLDQAGFKAKDWTSSEFGHLKGKEELPPNM